MIEGKSGDGFPPDMTYEERYVIRRMRREGMTIRPDARNGPLLFIGEEPVCTWPTLFSLMGRGLVRKSHVTANYLLTPEDGK